jgi:hypothetical protein
MNNNINTNNAYSVPSPLANTWYKLAHRKYSNIIFLSLVLSLSVSLSLSTHTYTHTHTHLCQRNVLKENTNHKYQMLHVTSLGLVGGTAGSLILRKVFTLRISNPTLTLTGPSNNMRHLKIPRENLPNP